MAVGAVLSIEPVLGSRRGLDYESCHKQQACWRPFHMRVQASSVLLVQYGERLLILEKLINHYIVKGRLGKVCVCVILG